MNASSPIRRVSIGAAAAASAAVVLAIVSALAAVPGAAADLASTEYVSVTLSGGEQKGPVLQVPCAFAR
jgi:hypothetical protein